MNIPELITVKQVAQHLLISEQYVRTLLRSGELVGNMIGNQWLITSEALKDYELQISTKDTVTDTSRVSTTLPPIKALSFFSGAMGLDLGLEKAGISVLLACEFDKACRMTISKNRPELALLGDIWDYSADDIRRAAGLTSDDEIDVIVGGPPCQAFSTAGARKGFNDERGNAFLKYLDLIFELRPRYAVIENVRGLLSAPLCHRPHAERGGGAPVLSPDEQQGGALLRIINLLRDAGYGVSFNLYNAANFGSPQIRERVVMICHREGLRVPYLMPTHSDDSSYGLPPWRTFSDAVTDLNREEHHYINFPEKRLRFYRLLKAGQYWRHLPEELQKEALGNSYYSGGGKTGFLRRLAWDRPSPTIVTHPAMPATDLAHPEEDRPLSIEEYKRVQEFPDDWIVCGSLLDQYRQIGNAVPTSLGAAIGRAIIAHMFEQKIVPPSDFPFSRYKCTDDKSWEATTSAVFTANNQKEDSLQFGFDLA